MQTGSAIRQRRLDLDWLRIIAFGLLIYYHSAVVFLPSGIPMIQNAEPSQVLIWMSRFLHEFRLALLFLVSGAGVAFALKGRSRGEFFRERSARLLVPLIFGVLVVVPPMIWLEKRFNGAFTGTFISFYAEYFTAGVYPEGHLSWHHYWFVAYLFLYCAIAWPLFAYLRSEPGQDRLRSLATWLRQGGNLYWVILPLLVLEMPLRALFPGFRDLIHDWASFSHWFVIFIAGFVFASDRSLLDRVQALRQPSLLFGLVTTAVLFGVYWSPERSGFWPFPDGKMSVTAYLGFCLVRMANAWFWLLACLGFAGRYLRRGETVVRYLTPSVYPLYCLHLPVIVASAYLIVPLPLGVWSKYFIITTITVALTMAVYKLMVRRVRWLGPLLGYRPSKTGPTLPGASIDLDQCDSGPSRRRYLWQ